MKRAVRYLFILVLLLMPCYCFASDTSSYEAELHLEQPFTAALEAGKEHSYIFIPEKNGIYCIEYSCDENQGFFSYCDINGKSVYSNDRNFYGRAGEKYMITLAPYNMDMSDPTPLNCAIGITTAPEWSKRVELDKPLKLSIYDDPYVFFQAEKTGFYRLSQKAESPDISMGYFFDAYSQDGTKYDPLISYLMYDSEEAILYLHKGDFCNIYTYDAELDGAREYRNFYLTMIPECKYGKSFTVSTNPVTNTFAVCFTPDEKGTYVFKDPRMPIIHSGTRMYDQTGSEDCFIKTKTVERPYHEDERCTHYFKGTPGNTVIRLSFYGRPVSFKTTVLTEDEYNKSQATSTKEVKDKKIPAVKSAKVKAASKGFTVSWKKPSKKQLKKFDKVEIQYSTRKSFPDSKTTSKLVRKTKKSLKVSKLKKKKTYYIRVRNIRTVNGVKHVSSWSKVRKIKTR